MSFFVVVVVVAAVALLTTLCSAVKLNILSWESMGTQFLNQPQVVLKGIATGTFL